MCPDDKSPAFRLRIHNPDNLPVRGREPAAPDSVEAGVRFIEETLGEERLAALFALAQQRVEAANAAYFRRHHRTRYYEVSRVSERMVRGLFVMDVSDKEVFAMRQLNWEPVLLPDEMFAAYSYDIKEKDIDAALLCGSAAEQRR